MLAGNRPEALKRYRSGTHRIRSPESTWAIIEPLFERVGITRVADVTALDRLGVPVFQAVRPRSKNLSVSQGKGLTADASRVSAAMEAIELWHAESLDHLPRTTATLQEMAYGNPIGEASLRWMQGTRALRATPIQWVRLESLTTDRVGWLPRSMVELDFSGPEWYEPAMFVANSNGLASGNNREEALLHGLCELIERHAWHLSQLDPGRLVPVDTNSLPVGPIRELVCDLRDRGARIGLYDFTWEVGVPAMFAQLVLPDLAVVWNGAGCHPSPEVAASRALTEAAQSRLTQIAGARDDLVRFSRHRVAHSAFEGFLEPREGRPLSAVEDLSSDSVGEDLRRVIARLIERGYEPFYLDLTRADFPAAVTLSFVPGLREMHG